MNTLNNKSNRYVVVFLGGIVLFEFSNYINIFYGISPVYVSMFSILCSLYALSKIGLDMHMHRNKSMNILCGLTIFMILRGSLIGNYLVTSDFSKYDDSLYDIFRHCFFDNYIFAFLMPFVYFFKFDIDNLKIFKKFGAIMAILGLVLAMRHIQTLLFASEWTDRRMWMDEKSFDIRTLTASVFVGIGFYKLYSFLFQYVDGWIKCIFPLAFFYSILCTIAGAGRGGSVMGFLTLVSVLYLWYSHPINVGRNLKSSRKMLTFFVTLSILGVLYYLYIYTSFYDYLFDRLFYDRNNQIMTESGREEFEAAMIRDFNDSPLSWIFGRGINGSYVLGNGYRRNTLEWGYMYLILKGGILYLVTYCYILLKTAYVGYFKSNNLLCKSLAILCLLRVIALIPFGFPSISIEFFIIWYGVKILNDNNVLIKSDEEIHHLINNK